MGGKITINNNFVIDIFLLYIFVLLLKQKSR